MRERPLEVSVEDGEIVIRIGVDTLRVAVQSCPSLERYDADSGNFLEPIVLDADLFASEVVTELAREEEDGTTVVHQLFDQAFLDAIGNGANGVQMPGDEP
jgi:hypothetical protein